MKEVPLYPKCFVCGQENQYGLKARFFWDGGKVVCDITAEEAYAGYRNVYHGGIIATLLDEVMIKALLAEEILAVTADLKVRFRRPVYCGDRLHFEGRQTQRQRAVYFTEGRVNNQDGEIVAEATAAYVSPREHLGERLRDSLSDD